MSDSRPIALSIAGFDPSGGAGILADIKTFEQLGVYGLGVCSALTVQNDIKFESIDWISKDKIISQLSVLLERFEVDFVKIGIIKNWSVLADLIFYLKSKNETIKIVLDPVLRSSTGFDIQKENQLSELSNILTNLALLTPNLEEAKILTNQSTGDTIKFLSTKCPILSKGGHREEAVGKDELWEEGLVKATFLPQKIAKSGKHGSGCVLSSAITAYLAKGENLVSACKKGKQYTEGFLNSNDTLLGYHFHK